MQDERTSGGGSGPDRPATSGLAITALVLGVIGLVMSSAGGRKLPGIGTGVSIVGGC